MLENHTQIRCLIGFAMSYQIASVDQAYTNVPEGV